MNAHDQSQAQPADPNETTAQDPADLTIPPAVSEPPSQADQPTPSDQPTQAGEPTQAGQPEGAASAEAGGSRPAVTTDELPVTGTAALVGEVEIIEPEAHRVPHPPAFGHNGGSHVGHVEGEGSVIAQLSDLIADRAAAPRKGSYTNSLLADPIKAQRKMMEEAFETCLELHTPTALVDHDALAAEAADLVFHLLVALRTQGMGWAEVEAKLTDRLGKPARHSTY